VNQRGDPRLIMTRRSPKHLLISSRYGTGTGTQPARKIPADLLRKIENTLVLAAACMCYIILYGIVTHLHWTGKRQLHSANRDGISISISQWVPAVHVASMIVLRRLRRRRCEHKPREVRMVGKRWRYPEPCRVHRSKYRQTQR
jgi:hypothetical protein